MGEYGEGACSALRTLQLLPCSPEPTGDASDGSRDHGPYLDTRRISGSNFLIGHYHAAKGKKVETRIDTVIRRDPQSGAVGYYFDIDCDGQIDLIGYDSDEDGTLDRYDLPQEPLQIASLTEEFAQALQQGLIPYPQLQICR